MLLYISKKVDDDEDRRAVLPMLDVRSLLGSLPDEPTEPLTVDMMFTEDIKGVVQWHVSSDGALLSSPLVILGSSEAPSGRLMVPGREAVFARHSEVARRLTKCLCECWCRSTAPKRKQQRTPGYNVVSWLKAQQPADIRAGCVPLAGIFAADHSRSCWANDAGDHAVIQLHYSGASTYGWIRGVESDSPIPRMNISDGLLIGNEDAWFQNALQALLEHHSLYHRCPEFHWSSTEIQLEHSDSTAWFNSHSGVVIVYREEGNSISLQKITPQPSFIESTSLTNETVVWKH